MPRGTHKYSELDAHVFAYSMVGSLYLALPQDFFHDLAYHTCDKFTLLPELFYFCLPLSGDSLSFFVHAALKELVDPAPHSLDVVHCAAPSNTYCRYFQSSASKCHCNATASTNMIKQMNVLMISTCCMRGHRLAVMRNTRCRSSTVSDCCTRCCTSSSWSSCRR